MDADLWMRPVCACRAARVLVRRARKTAQAYFQMYKEHIPVAQLVRETAAVMQEFTRGLGRRRVKRQGTGLGRA